MGTIDRYLYRIADDIDRDGIAAVEADVASVVRRARDVEIDGIALDVLADRAEPSVARSRAFGIVATRLYLHDRAVTGRRGTLAAAGV
jgi:hypothetical protein